MNATDLDGNCLRCLLGVIVRGVGKAGRATGKWFRGTAGPWLNRNIVQPVWQGTKWLGRTFVINPCRCIRANPGRALLRYGVFGSMGYKSMGVMGAIVGCYGDLVHDAWRTKKW